MADNKKTLANDFTQGNVPRQLITFAMPLLISGLLQTVYNVVDVAVVGRVVGSDGLAGASVGGDLLHLITFFGMGFANAGQVIISQYIGAGKKERIKPFIGTLFTFLFLCGVVVTTVCLILRAPMLRLLNTPEEAWGHAMSYLVICVSGILFIYGYNLVSAILRGMGDSRHPFLFIALAAVTNIALDLLFVIVFHWGTAGAALATVISQALSFILSIVFLYRRREAFGFDFKLSSFGIRWDSFVPLVRLGVPLVLQSAAISGSRLFVNANINSYGVVATAVTGIGAKLTTATSVFVNALSTAGSTMIGQNIGAKKYERVPKVISSAFFVDLVVCGTLAVILVLFPKAVFGLFAKEAETLDMAMLYVPVALVNLGGNLVRPPMLALINGSGNSRLNLIVGLFDGVICRIGLSVLLGEVLGFGIFGYWYGCSLAGFVPGIIGAIYYATGKWKTNRYVMRNA